jgi:hypothetical protein
MSRTVVKVFLTSFASYYFCLMIESRSGSVPQTKGSGSVRPKNIRNLWIQIRSIELLVNIEYKILMNITGTVSLTHNQWWAKLLRLLTVNSLSYFVKIKY